MHKSKSFFFAAFVLLAAACIQTVDAGAGRARIPTKVKYKDVQKIFDGNCIGCHGARARAGVDLRTYESVMKGGASGAIIKAKDADHSVLYKAIKGLPGVPHMPPKGPLSGPVIKSVHDWIQQGAKK